MNDTKLAKLLEMYFENEDMQEYAREKQDEKMQAQYRTANYTLEKAIGIMLEIENIWIICTKIYKSKSEYTIVRVYKDNESMDESNLYCTYYPIADIVKYPAK